MRPWTCGLPDLAADRAWTMHALAAVERDRGHPACALDLLTEALVLHRAGESVHGEAWAHFQLGQLGLRMGDVPRAERELRDALACSAVPVWSRSRQPVLRGRGPAPAASRHRENEDARGEAWTVYYLGQSLEETGNLDQAVRELERSRTMFSRMRDVYGLACARHHSARVTRDQRLPAQLGLRPPAPGGRARRLPAHRRGPRRGVDLPGARGGRRRKRPYAGGPRPVRRGGRPVRLVRGPARRGLGQVPEVHPAPYGSPGGLEVGSAVAQEELAQLSRTGHPLRDGKLDDYVEAYQLLLEQEDDLDAGMAGLAPGNGAGPACPGGHGGGGDRGAVGPVRRIRSQENNGASSAQMCVPSPASAA